MLSIKSFKFHINWEFVLKVLLGSAAIVLFIFTLSSIYFLGLVSGYRLGQEQISANLYSFFENSPAFIQSVKPTIPPSPTSRPTTVVRVTWGGPELWSEVNKKRVEFGVNPLQDRSELCTIAAIRLNELLELGKLDNHEGFSNMPERRPDLKWVFDKYSTIAEFLAVGGKTPEETVGLWEHTLGHKRLLDAGEYVWGCVYAQNTFAVAITAY